MFSFKNFKKRFTKSDSRPKKLYAKTVRYIDHHPLTGFFSLLALLFLVIIIGSFTRKPPVPPQNLEQAPKIVQTYTIGAAAIVSVPAQVEKSGIVQITAQTPAIVDKIHVTIGQQVWRGTNLISLSSNYRGSNPLSVAKQLAAAQHKNVQDTFASQKDLINKQRELADKNRENTQKLREISSQSLGETRDLISLNESIISSLQVQLESQTPGSLTYIAYQQQISQFQGANNQLRQGVRNAEFQSSSNKLPAQIADIQTDIAKKQLDLQEKALELSKQTSALQLRLAQVNEANYFPVSPFEGTVERIHVQLGDSVNPGTVLVTITGTSQTATVQAFVPMEVAQHISPFETAILHLGSQTLDLNPSYISQEATNGQLYSVIFAIPAEFESYITDKSYVTIDLPIQADLQSATDPFIPIDSVRQTQNDAYVFVVDDQKALSKKVQLGTVQGNYIQVLAGLDKTDIVIVSRNVISGDKVYIENQRDVEVKDNGSL